MAMAKFVDNPSKTKSYNLEDDLRIFQTINTEQYEVHKLLIQVYQGVLRFDVTRTCVLWCFCNIPPPVEYSENKDSRIENHVFHGARDGFGEGGGQGVQRSMSRSYISTFTYTPQTHFSLSFNLIIPIPTYQTQVPKRWSQLR